MADANSDPFADDDELKRSLSLIAGALETHGAIIHDLAMIAADYYKTLLKEGMPEAMAQGLTVQYQMATLQRLLYGDPSDKGPGA